MMLLFSNVPHIITKTLSPLDRVLTTFLLVYQAYIFTHSVIQQYQ